ncbi:SURF1 family protein [Nitratireductor basaltis]|uniref:SURF1-like protein n=1 Tax=Nitratireductor basaltis TaxID=472175 RepID=A0A084UCR6_9HYPH|nr:SURF1 family protein [Nitratireductor basaltis]KFB10752.1 Surfeit locus 1 [Nitratireductor basaltis]
MRASRRANLILLSLALPALVVLLMLGTWQVKRLQWKETLVARIEERINAEPQPLERLDDLYRNGGDIDYRPVTLSGRFDHSRERHYLATLRGESGFQVHTPMALDAGDYIFVNRGFVPYDRKDPATRESGQMAGDVTIEGLARTASTHKPSFIVPDNDPQKNIFYWKDIDAMASSAGLSTDQVRDYYVDAGPQENAGGLPIGGVTRINLPNNHLQYAITWYGLALALVGVLLVWFLRRDEETGA